MNMSTIKMSLSWVGFTMPRAHSATRRVSSLLCHLKKLRHQRPGSAEQTGLQYQSGMRKEVAPRLISISKDDDRLCRASGFSQIFARVSSLFSVKRNWHVNGPTWLSFVWLDCYGWNTPVPDNRSSGDHLRRCCATIGHIDTAVAADADVALFSMANKSFEHT